MTNQIKELKKRSKYRENLLEQIVKSRNPIDNFRDPINYLVLAREWNSWYPSTFQVSGGCYFFNLNEEIIVIDPGFNTLEKLIENQLDIRLVRHIFITHFHPDHFNNLSKLLTRLPSKEHKVSVYLNTTSYNQFKIYMRENTEFYELIPNIIIKLETTKKEDRFNIDVEVTKAFHREIGGSMSSIGLKFILNHHQDVDIKYVIGFMSDTDGYEKYIESYIKDYNDCDILIPHLGSIHPEKAPMGYKHLYLKGTEELLKSLASEKDPVHFLGEFGLELASDKTFFEGLTHFIPSKISYLELMKDLYKIFYSKEKGDEKGDKVEESFSYNIPIIKLFIKRFESIINKIKNQPFLKLEVLLPFLLFDMESIKTYEESGITALLGKLEKKIEFFIKNVQEDDFKNIWWRILKKVAFQADNTSEHKKKLEKFLDNLDLKELREKMDKNCELIIPFFSKDFREELSFSRIIPSKGGPTASISSLLPNGIELEVNQYEPYKLEANYRHIFINEGIINFRRINDLLRTYFKNQNIINNSKFEWFIFTFSVYFLLKALESKTEIYKELQDGRSGVCKYLQRKCKKTVIPVHDSYKIIFDKNEIKLEGYCENNHKTNYLPLTRINRDWDFFPKKTKEDKNADLNNKFINVIPINDCIKCMQESIRVKYEKKMEQEWEENEGKFLIEEQEEVIKQYEDELSNITDLKELFYFYSTDFKNEIFGINSAILKKKVFELIENSNLSPQEIILYLIHPKLIVSEVIQEIVSRHLEKLKKDQILTLICDIFSNPLPYKEIEQEPVYLYLLINKDFSRLIISKIENKVNLEFLVKAIKYFKELKEYKKSYNQKFNVFLKFIKQKAIDVLYPLIEEPSKYEQEYELLKKNEDFTTWLEELGYPLDNFANFLNSNLGYGYITPRFLKSLTYKSKDFKNRFLWF